MKIVIASGKGGTGKTTLSVNLAQALSTESGVGLLDCDVEEPNCHLYLKPTFEPDQPVNTPVPRVDEDTCTACGMCARSCEFHALLALPGAPLVMPELCHGCGVCTYVCPEGAIAEEDRAIGSVGSGMVDDLYFRWGALNVGEARATPVIDAVKDLEGSPPLDTVIIDAPPGTACPAVQTLRGADFAILVTEPTPFGLHDLRLAIETARLLEVPCGVVINRYGVGDNRVENYCAAEKIPILLRIPYDRSIAKACSQCEIYAADNEPFAHSLRALAADIRSRVAEVALV